jgi:hypothetical protein
MHAIVQSDAAAHDEFCGQGKCVPATIQLRFGASRLVENPCSAIQQEIFQSMIVRVGVRLPAVLANQFV